MECAEQKKLCVKFDNQNRSMSSFQRTYANAIYIMLKNTNDNNSNIFTNNLLLEI